MASTINAKTTGVGGIDASGDASGVLALQTGGTTAVTIGTGQLVGINTTSTGGRLAVNGNPPIAGAISSVASSATGYSLALSDNVNSSLYVSHPAGGVVKLSTDGSGQIAIATNGTTTAVTIDASQNVKLSAAGTTIQNSSGRAILNQTGSVLQVVSALYGTQVTSSTGTIIDTGLSATITPSSTSSKILVMVSQAGVFKANVASVGSNFYINRAGVNLSLFGYVVGYTSVATYIGTTISGVYLDSPATTSATIYKTTFSSSGVATDVQRDNAGISSIVLMEIAG